MPAGTIALTNGSNAVSGTGTSFTTELKQGDFVYVTVGSAPYTLVVSSVVSNTQLILSIAFDGPTTSGLAWNAVPASMQVAITQKILNDFAQVARGRILDFQNWQKIYSSDQSVTVTRPDRTTFTGPSWGYMAAQFGGKLDKTQNLNDLADKAAARTNIGFVDGLLPISLGGTAGKTAADARKNLGLGSAAVKNTGNRGDSIPLLNVSNTWDAVQYCYNGYSILAKASTSSNATTLTSRFVAGFDNADSSFGMYCEKVWGGNVAGGLVNRADGVEKFWRFEQNGNAFAVSGSWNNGSDENIKYEIKRIESPLDKMRQIKGATWKRKDSDKFGIGFIAQDVEKVWPDAVSNSGYDLPMPDGTVVKNVKSLNAGDIAAALHHEAILALMDKLEEKDTIIAELQKRMKAIDGLDA